ncbi:hypothetical protein [Natranaerobius trueperi]|uniref:Lipoprotein n=1 Tax=Natranaerobius trueperi TaxID=759412 RepID=A0A226C1V6_9FIRM|nr:hypothetical protein [Natranaerobius trueperi]OWZ84419.1 hypothetical protein CDO51_03915 [Natranaerobius trueperi]
MLKTKKLVTVICLFLIFIVGCKESTSYDKYIVDDLTKTDSNTKVISVIRPLTLTKKLLH